jgi:hypothetical protein
MSKRLFVAAGLLAAFVAADAELRGQRVAVGGGRGVVVGPHGGTVVQKTTTTVIGPAARPVVVTPRPVVVAPKPVVVAPRPVVVAPRPVVVAPRPPVVLGPAHVVTTPKVVVGPFHGAHFPITAPVVVGHRTAFISAPVLTNRAFLVRRNFTNFRFFTPTWYTAHPRAWRPLRWGPLAFWGAVTWNRLVNFCRFPIAPIVYDYGSTLVYQGNDVYYNGTPIATADQYAQQATALALQGQQAPAVENEEWQSLGVFGAIQGDEQQASNVFQLAINANGVIRGNYTNTLNDMTLPVFGSVIRRRSGPPGSSATGRTWCTRRASAT